VNFYPYQARTQLDELRRAPFIWLQSAGSLKDVGQGARIH
jgi:hypothetical protein